MKSTPNTEIGSVRDVLGMIDRGMTTEQILRAKGWKVEEFYSERDKVMKYRVRDSAKYFVTSNKLSREAAIEAAFYDPYRS